MMRTGDHRNRQGFTLLEVLVALAIFLMSFVAISHLLGLSTDMAEERQLRAQAMQLCRSKMAEIFAGAEQLTSQSDLPFPNDSSWTWSADCNQGPVNNLWTVQVRVSRQRPDGSKLEVTLGEMMLDPSVRGTTANLSVISGTSTSNGGGM